MALARTTLAAPEEDADDGDCDYANDRQASDTYDKRPWDVSRSHIGKLKFKRKLGKKLKEVCAGRVRCVPYYNGA